MFVFVLAVESSAHLEPLLARHHWTLDGATVKFPENESNTPKDNVDREHIEIARESTHLSPPLSFVD